MQRFLQSAVILVGLLPPIVFGINCYECQKDDFLCSPGLLGQKVPCKPEVTHCIKTWTVETSPKTKRSCGTSKVVESKCKDLLFGANTMLYCPCHTDYCNPAGRLLPTNLLETFFPRHYHRSYQSQPKVAFFALVLILNSFHHIASTLQTYLYS